jgi:MFS family permease
MTSLSPPVAPESRYPYPPPAVAWYAVAVLLVAYTNSFIDRTIIALLVQPIQRDLGIGDTQLSLLHGFAFAIFYTTLGLPIARLSDRYSRRWIIVVGTIFWSVMTASCGLAQRYWQLFLARVGVGVGEASLSPAAYSMIADLFPRERLGRALGVYSTGVFLGAGLAFIIGGLVVKMVTVADTVSLPLFGEVRPWQATFILVGLPGVLIGLLMLTFPEPVRHGVTAALPQGRLFGDWFAFIRTHRRTFVAHFLGFSLAAVVFNGFVAWAPAQWMRDFGLGPGQVGVRLGLIIVVFGPAGIVCGGLLSDWYTRHGRLDGTMRAGLVGVAGLVLPAVLAPIMPTMGLTLVAYAAFFFFSSFPYGAAAAALQVVTPNRLRAQVSALYLLCLNLIGIGLGPTVMAAIGEYLLGGPQYLGRAMAITAAVVTPLAAFALYRGLAPFRESARLIAAN